MKKIVLFLIIILSLTGCEAVYNIEVVNDTIKDELIINNYDVSSWNSNNPSYKTLVDNNYREFNLAIDKNTPGYPEMYNKLKGYNYYNKELINENNNYGLKFNYEYKENEKYENNPLLVFYSNLSITNNKKVLRISIPDGKECYIFDHYPLMDKFIINLKTDNVVNNANADKYENNTYTWEITKSNYLNKSIYFEVDKLSEKIDYSKTNKIRDIMIDIFLVLIGLSIIYIIIKVKKAQ